MAGDVSALSFDDKVGMLRISSCLFFIIFTIFFVDDQGREEQFLTDLSIKYLGLGSKLSELERNKKISKDLFVVPINDSITMVTLKSQAINFYNLENISQVYLNFKRNSLTDIVIEILKSPGDDEFEQTTSLFYSKFGKPIVKQTKNSFFNTYVWNNGKTKLMLKPLKYSFIIKYYRASDKP